MKKIFCLFCLLATVGLFGANLLPDPEFDQSLNSARIDSLPGNFKITRITEDRTWNKACRIEYLKPYQKAGEPGKCFLTVLWSSEKDGGVKVKPNTRYRFSMSVIRYYTTCKQFCTGYRVDGRRVLEGPPPSADSQQRQFNKVYRCAGNLKQQHTIQMIYAADNKEFMTSTMKTINGTTQNYMTVLGRAGYVDWDSSEDKPARSTAGYMSCPGVKELQVFHQTGNINQIYGYVCAPRSHTWSANKYHIKDYANFHDPNANPKEFGESDPSAAPLMGDCAWNNNGAMWAFYQLYCPCSQSVKGVYPGHNKWANMVMLDGHVTTMTKEDAENCKWHPLHVIEPE